MVCWSSVWINPREIESRLTVTIVCLLALIAYNFVFNEDLPKLYFLTSLDRYILLSYLFCSIPTFLTIYFSRLTKKDYPLLYNAVSIHGRHTKCLLLLSGTPVLNNEHGFLQMLHLLDPDLSLIHI